MHGICFKISETKLQTIMGELRNLCIRIFKYFQISGFPDELFLLSELLSEILVSQEFSRWILFEYFDKVVQNKQLSYPPINWNKAKIYLKQWLTLPAIKNI